ncbi:hypothetical protein C4544_06615 [candidate division WS5 bacterium]|uniref:DUF6879 domain-containing protein n=1 Tax=candidate division WS5 bacterium TaxID=2093353 RepID=A0A419DA97_9BACT|nr:MAG: hypothetical protein C4544_06615 [candidate division WS5 bacterium]
MKVFEGQGREVFEKFKNETQERAFKLETLQYYAEDADDPSLKKWLNGDKNESIRLLGGNAKERSGWWPKDEKIKKTRIHIIEYPLSEYIKWEIEAYRYVNIPYCGEEVYLLDSKHMDEYQNIPEGWIYDDNRAVIINYDKNGKVLGFETYEGDEVKPFINLRERLLKLPLEEIK